MANKSKTFTLVIICIATNYSHSRTPALKIYWFGQKPFEKNAGLGGGGSSHVWGGGEAQCTICLTFRACFLWTSKELCKFFVILDICVSNS